MSAESAKTCSLSARFPSADILTLDGGITGCLASIAILVFLDDEADVEDLIGEFKVLPEPVNTFVVPGIGSIITSLNAEFV